VISHWATSGFDLHVELHGTGRRRALEEALREAIADGRLPAGTRLPSSRSLAADLGVARNTVADAYDQLAAEGWLEARRGSGTSVGPRPPGAVAAGLTSAETRPTWRYDLRPGVPDLASFPRAAWLSASRRAWASVPDVDLGYGDPRGTRQLREALASYLGRARGVRTDPSRIVVCSGFGQAVELVCRALVERGATSVAFEGYGLPDLRRIAAGCGLEVAAVPVDDEGAELARAGGADAAVLTPAHQYPLGSVMTPRRRHEALAWAAVHGAVIVEDDYDGEFRYDREPLGALQGLDPERVVYAGTASKTLAPGLRLAWLALPADLVEPVAETRRLTDRHSAVLEQLTLAEFINSGAYDRHVRRRRGAYRRRRDRLVGVLPAGTVEGISAGLHALVGLPAPLTEAEAIGAAAREGLGLFGLDSYRGEVAGRPPALVVGYATPPDHAYEGALAALGRAATRP